MKNRLHLGVLAALAVALTTLAGCSASAPADTAPADLPAVSIDDYGDVTATLDYEHAVATLPIDDYDLTSPDYVIRVLHAIAAKTDTCMVDNGFPATAQNTDWSVYQKEEDRLYGLWSVDYASTYGVELAPNVGPPLTDTVAQGVEFNKQYATCKTEATDALEAELTFSQEVNVTTQIRARANELALATTEGTQAKKSWQTCMEDRGIVLEKLDGRPSSQYQQQGKEAEIGAAVVEAECARSTGAIQQLYDIQARFEAALIDAQAAQLTAFSERRDRAIAVFDDAIAGR